MRPNWRTAVMIVGMAVALAVAPQSRAQAQPKGRVEVRGGDIFYADAGGAGRRLTFLGKDSDPALSPDERLLAFVRTPVKTAKGVTESDPTELWVTEPATGDTRRVLASRHSDEAKANLTTFHGPAFSLDGRFVYVEANAWATSGAIHRVDLQTGATRFVIDGNSLQVLRTGRYRGWLIVSRHRYHGAPNYGSFDPCYAVRPDGAQSFMIPGTEKDDCDASLDRWLKAGRFETW